MTMRILLFLLITAIANIPLQAEQGFGYDDEGTATGSARDRGSETAGRRSEIAEPPAAELTKLEPSTWKGDGRIIGDKFRKQMISEGDVVYVNLGRDTISPDDELQVFRRIGRIKNLHAGAPRYEAVTTPSGASVRDRYNPDMHYEIRFVGTLRVTGFVGLNGSTARVIVSREPIYVGDWVKIVRAGR